MDSKRDLQQFHLDVKAISFNLALSNFLLCKAIVAEPQLGIQPLVLQSLSLQNNLMTTLQNSLSKLEPIQNGHDNFESILQKFKDSKSTQDFEEQFEKTQVDKQINIMEQPQQALTYGTTEPEAKPTGNKRRRGKNDSTDTLRARIGEILDLFIENKGLIAENDFEEKKNTFKTDPLLVQLFDCLNARYNSSFKTKEEMTKYIIRKSFKSIKLRVFKQEGVNKKNATKTMIQKFFSEELVAQIRKELPINASEEQILEYLLPFKKKSKNKTINSNFVSQVFASKGFLTEFEIFMDKFDSFTRADNKKKCQKFVDTLLECYKNKSFERLRNYKRVPWLLAWIKKTQRIAMELPSQTVFNKNSPKEILPNKEEEFHPVQKKLDTTKNKRNALSSDSSDALTKQEADFDSN